jgi:hypothetical protein
MTKLPQTVTATVIDGMDYRTQTTEPPPGDWTTCSDPECGAWKVCTKAHACLSGTLGKTQTTPRGSIGWDIVFLIERNQYLDAVKTLAAQRRIDDPAAALTVIAWMNEHHRGMP